MPKTVAKNNGGSGRVSLSADQLERLGVDVGDEVWVDVAESAEVAHAIVDAKESEQFVVITPVE